MKKTSLIIVSVFILLTAGAAGYLALQKDEQPADNSQQTSTPSGLSATNAGQQTPAAPVAAAPGGYVEYNDDVIASTAGKKVLFFHAPWCSQCRSIEAGIKEQGVPAGLTIIKVDYDSHQDLRQKYGVKLQTAFVKVDDSGNKTDLYVAYEEPTFDSVKRNFLNL